MDKTPKELAVSSANELCELANQRFHLRRELSKLKQERDLLQSRLQYAKEQALIAENIEKRLMQQLKDAEVQRDEAVALAEVMRDALTAISDENSDDDAFTNCSSLRIAYEQIARRALSITPSAALREIQARTLESAAKCIVDDYDRYAVERRAADLRKGE